MQIILFNGKFWQMDNKIEKKLRKVRFNRRTLTQFCLESDIRYSLRHKGKLSDETCDLVVS